MINCGITKQKSKKIVNLIKHGSHLIGGKYVIIEWRENLNPIPINFLQGNSMKQEDKIKTLFGHIETVMKVEDKRIFTYENLTGWYHPTKVLPVSSENKKKTE